MSLTLLAVIFTVMIATSFLSGLFGMAGGLVLIGVLLFIMPVPAAMALHAITQIASNIWRAALWWRYIRWPVAVAYAGGCLVVLFIWNFYQYVPSVAVALLLLGVVPFIGKMIPECFLLADARQAQPLWSVWLYRDGLDVDHRRCRTGARPVLSQ
ncbi:MAG: TSUP family transporter [Alphaproteobacteria bacterium]